MYSGGLFCALFAWYLVKKQGKHAGMTIFTRGFHESVSEHL